MTNTTQVITPTLVISDEPTARLNPGRDRPFAIVGLSPTMDLFIHDASHARAIAAAFTQAGDLLEDYAAAQACGDVAEHTKRPCELPPGHEGWHRAGMITWEPGKEIRPARPPATHCPSCGTDLEPSGRCPACSASGCGARLASEESLGGYFYCTEDAGHDGDHIAGGARSMDEEPLTWPREVTP